MSNITLYLLVLVGFIALIDFLPRIFIAKNRQSVVPTSYGKIPDYRILPTVYGNISYLQNLEFLKKYRAKVVICTSKYETEDFYRDLKRVCKQNGLRYICADLPKVNGKPIKNAYTIYRGALESNRLNVPKGTPCLLMDADTYASMNINNLMRAFLKSGYDVASLRCEVDNPQTAIEALQAFEYSIAMDGRNMDSWLTSGACNVGKAGVLGHVFRNHSNYFAGGDIEIGKLAQTMGYSVGHLDFTFYTSAPDTFKAWFNQRIIWFTGGVRHHVTNIGSFGWQHFFMLFYNSLLIYLLLPLRWLEFVKLPILLPIAMLFSWLYVIILTQGRGWKLVYLLLPFYSFMQTMVILPLAFIRYLKLVRIHRSLGLIKHDYSRFTKGQRRVYKTLNVASAALVLIAAGIFTAGRIDYWMGDNTQTVVAAASTEE